MAGAEARRAPLGSGSRPSATSAYVTTPPTPTPTPKAARETRQRSLRQCSPDMQRTLAAPMSAGGRSQPPPPPRRYALASDTPGRAARCMERQRPSAPAPPQDEPLPSTPLLRIGCRAARTTRPGADAALAGGATRPGRTRAGETDADVSERVALAPVQRIQRARPPGTPQQLQLRHLRACGWA